MPSKLNSEFNYRYQVIGHTHWEKIHTLQGFLEGRVRAAALEEVSNLKHQAKRAELEHVKQSGALPHVILTVEAELKELESFLPSQSEAFELNREEIKTLERLIAELKAEAEPTRIPGYTDEQMWEANAANEFTVNVAKEIQSELIAHGRPSPAKVMNAMSNPHSLKALQKIGLLPVDCKPLLGSVDPNDITLTLLENAAA